MQNTKFRAILLVLVMLAGLFVLSPAISQLMNSVVIRSTGRIGTGLYVTAKSGHWSDIQAAIDQAQAIGADTVYIPPGTFNFVEPGEPWPGDEGVVVDLAGFPSGIKIFGAPTERTSGLPVPPRGMNPNDQVVEWKTVLVMPWDVPSNEAIGEKTWFTFEGNGDPNRPARFSDIKLVGYREFDSTSTYYHTGVSMHAVIDFRIDHNFFKHVCAGITVRGRPDIDVDVIRGVIDHNRMINDVGIPAPYDDRTIDYGVNAHGTPRSTRWEPDISKILGKYLDYTVFIEDNYFSKWRHVVAGNCGQHYVFRHNTIQYDFGQGSIDAHGQTIEESVGTRAIEVYNNLFINRDDPQGQWTAVAIQIRGGGGVIFDNYEDGTYETFVYLTASEGWDPKCYPKDIWIWNNEIGAPVFLEKYQDLAPIREGIEYHLHAPDTFVYTPYPYPHPLTL